MTVTETKADAYRRLLQEERWEKATDYRLAKKDEFRKEGESTQDAKELSWAAMIEHFPPTEETLEGIRKREEEQAAKEATKQAGKREANEPSSILGRDAKFVDPAAELDGDADDPESIAGAELDELVARSAEQDVDFESDLLWAYHNIYKRYVRPKDAPSQGAWAQLQYSRKDPKKFMETVNKVLGTAVSKKRKNRQDDSMDQYEMLREFKKGMGIKLTDEEIAASEAAAV